MSAMLARNPAAPGRRLVHRRAADRDSPEGRDRDLARRVPLPDTTNHLILEGIEGLRPHLGQRGVIIVAPHAGPYTMLGLMGGAGWPSRVSAVS